MRLTTPKILVVDNDHNLRKQVQNQLREQYLVIGAENGLEALDLMKEDSGFDVLLVDMVMPLMDGLELVREIRKLPAYESIPVVMMAHTIDLATRRRALLGGSVGVLPKPLDPFELEFKLRNISDLSLNLRVLTGHAHTDPRTGLPDPIAAADNIKNEYDRCRRAGVSLAIVKFKMDRYQEVQAASAKQCETTERLIANLLLSAFQRPNDRLGYLGKGEFILSTAEHSLNPLRYYLESLRKSVEELEVPAVANGDYHYVTISAGAALGHPNRGEHTLSEFLSVTDKCLADACSQGNTVSCRGIA